MSVPLFTFVKRLNTPVYKCRKSNRSIANRFLREKVEKDIGLRFRDFGLEMVQNHHSLLMDLGHNQHQHPTVHSGGVSRGRVHGCGCWR